VTPFALGPRAIAAYNYWRHFSLAVEGLEHVPARGGALIAARHYHHLYDGSALVMGLPRQPHIFVALDWTRTRFERRIMETVCRLADWPIALRGDALADDASASAFQRTEALRYVRRSLATGADILRRGNLLVVFPEGYPTIDPVRSRKASDDAFLPFRPGLFAIVAQAERAGAPPVPIVPAGLAYARAGERYRVTLRFGAPVFARDASRAELTRTLEERVRALSAAA
jgi:1-acyl-sn-glycerol-3-phosphate acyltransferase